MCCHARVSNAEADSALTLQTPLCEVFFFNDFLWTLTQFDTFFVYFFFWNVFSFSLASVPPWHKVVLKWIVVFLFHLPLKSLKAPLFLKKKKPQSKLIVQHQNSDYVDSNIMCYTASSRQDVDIGQFFSNNSWLNTSTSPLCAAVMFVCRTKSDFWLTWLAVLWTVALMLNCWQGTVPPQYCTGVVTPAVTMVTTYGAKLTWSEI